VDLVGQQRCLMVLIVGTLLVFLKLYVVGALAFLILRLEARYFRFGHILPHSPELLSDLRHSPLRVRLCHRWARLVGPQEESRHGALGRVEVLRLAGPFAHGRLHFHDRFHIHCDGHIWFCRRV